MRNSAAAMAAGAAAADDEDRLSGGQLADPLGHLVERDEPGAGHVGLDVLVGLAHVEQEGAGGQAVRQLIDADLGHSHVCRLAMQVRRRVRVRHRSRRHRHLDSVQLGEGTAHGPLAGVVERHRSPGGSG